MFSTQKQINRSPSFTINTGDALLVKSRSGWLNRLINYFSGSEFIHTAIAVRIDNHMYVVESKFSSRFSYQMMPLEWWFARHSDGDLFLGKMPVQGNRANTGRKIRSIVMDTMESLRSYEISWIFAVYFLQVWFGKKRPQFKRAFKNRPMICSTLVQEAWERAGVIPEGDYMTPGDLVTLLGGEQALTPFEDSVPADINAIPAASNDSRQFIPQLVTN